MNHQIQIPETALLVLSRLNESFSAYLAGGCVRDYLLSRTPHDWDIATSATPDEVKAALPEFQIRDTGLKHGTVTVIIGTDAYEVTTFRVDGRYSDQRHPDGVTFVTCIEDDLARRDFTVNAMAMSLDGTIIDPYGGRKHLADGLIACVGDPEERFHEDPLRILRAMRFASKLGFQIGVRTSRAMLRSRYLLASVSSERIQSELCKILAYNPTPVLRTYREIFAETIPELRPCFDFEQHNPYHCYDVYEHIVASVEQAPPDITVRLAMLFHDIGKPARYFEDDKGVGHFYGHAGVSADMTRAIMHRLCFSNREIHDVVELVAAHDTRFEPTPKFVKRMLNKYGEEQFRRLIEVRKADVMAQSGYERKPRLEKIRRTIETLAAVLSDRSPFVLKDLAVDGHDLIRAGIPAGPEIGWMLNRLLELVIEEILPNDHEILAKAAKQIQRDKWKENKAKEDKHV